ncbi:hypothetical protein NKH77_54250 [Streptomyces sp. M19]
MLLTDVRPVADGRYAAAACWPRSHPTFPVTAAPCTARC